MLFQKAQHKIVSKTLRKSSVLDLELEKKKHRPQPSSRRRPSPRSRPSRRPSRPWPRQLWRPPQRPARPKRPPRRRPRRRRPSPPAPKGAEWEKMQCTSTSKRLRGSIPGLYRSRWLQVTTKILARISRSAVSKPMFLQATTRESESS